MGKQDGVFFCFFLADFDKMLQRMDAAELKIRRLEVNVKVKTGYRNETTLRMIANSEMKPGSTVSNDFRCTQNNATPSATIRQLTGRTRPSIQFSFFIWHQFKTDVISRHFPGKVIPIQIYKNSNRLKVFNVRNPSHRKNAQWDEEWPFLQNYIVTLTPKNKKTQK